MTIFAVISGAESWEDIEDFGETHLDFLKQYGDFENGIPVHDTIARVVSCISPAKFHECFINWMRDCHSSNDKDVIAIDGKTLRHSYDKSRRRGAIHVISAFSTMHSLVIGQIKTDKKSNEITGFAPIFPDTCYHLTHYWPAAADIPVASDNPVHYADAIRYNARTPLQGSLLPLTRLV
ncbi:transposase IS4 family protein [Escherichia coli]|nr:transposase IS4 family protein [Escherichia coli]